MGAESLAGAVLSGGRHACDPSGHRAAMERPIVEPVQRGVLSVFGLHLFAAADWPAPGLRDTRALAMTPSFALLRSIQYAMWLIAVPAADRRGPRPRLGNRRRLDHARSLVGHRAILSPIAARGSRSPPGQAAPRRTIAK